MKKILVDSRACGAGKTTKTIIPQIKKNASIGIKSLVVVPSHKLQYQYQDALITATVINSETGDGVNAQLQTALVNKDINVIVISHQAFMYHTKIPNSVRDNVALVIDEAFDPYNSEQIDLLDSAGRRYFDFEGVFDWLDPEISEIEPDIAAKSTDWYRISVVSSTPPTLLASSQQWMRLTNGNTRLWATWAAGNTLINNDGTQAKLVRELSPDLMQGWHSVWVAAAAFEHTFMAQWLVDNSLDLIEVYPFEVHTAPLRLHLPNVDKELNWSMNFCNTQPAAYKKAVDWINKQTQGKVLYVRNDKHNLKVEGVQLSHNAHGLNEYTHFTRYAHLSALRPNPNMGSFFTTKLGMSKQQQVMAFNGYTCYQLMMRTALRDSTNTSWVDVYVLDTTLGLCLLDLFENHLALTDIPLRDPREKKEPLTPAEKQRLYRQRKKLKVQST